MFKVPPPTLGQVEEGWVAGYWKGKHQLLTYEVLGAIKASDIGNLRSLSHHHVHASNTRRLPAECQDKRVLKQLLDERLDELGHCRLVITREIVTEIMHQKGHVPWGKVGPFAFVVEAGQSAKLLHRPTKTLADIDEDMGVQSGGWGLDKNWSDTKCVIEKPPARQHNVLAFFPRQTKP